MSTDVFTSGQATDAKPAPAPTSAPGPKGPLVYRQSVWTRLTHWVWAVSMFFLLLTGLQIFNAHPALYLGKQTGFGFNNAILSLSAENTPAGPKGYTDVLGHRFDTTGVLGLSTDDSGLSARGFPAWATIPSYHDLASGRVVHFFFAWVFAGTLGVWFAASVLNGHAWRDLVPSGQDWRRLPRDVWDHLRLRFHHARDYNTLQKLSYGGVLFILMPLMIVTGLAMSPSFNAVAPFLNEVLGGRQTARTLHFTGMALLVLFFVVHVLMVVAAGPLNEMRSILTGWYRTDPAPGREGPR